VRLRSRDSLLLPFALVLCAAAARAEAPPTFDAARRSAAAARPASRSAEVERLAREFTVRSMDERYDVPSFVWAPRVAVAASPSASNARPGRSADAAARAHLAGLAPLYRLGKSDLEGTRLRHLHDTGRGAIIASYTQVVDGVDVFRDEFKVCMDRDLALVSVAGHLPARSLAAKGAAGRFALDAGDAVSRALRDFGGLDRAVTATRKTAADVAGYETYAAPAEMGERTDGLAVVRPVRAKRVWFRLASVLEPAHYVEVMGETAAFAYVYSAVDGRVLFKHSLMQDVAFAYRTWADASSPFRPFDGPGGNNPSPHPTGVPDFFTPAFVAPSLVSLQNGPISTNDPWLAPGATVTSGNNVDAYVDLSSPDGLSAGDFRASVTSPGVFDHAYNTALAPSASATQRSASVTTLFYLNNFLHDWFYDAGFDEASGNAQVDNYGRGGLGGDGILAEGQDYSGVNNANMSTPSDGGSPRMQMYVFNVNSAQVTVSAPAVVAGSYIASVATGFGPQTFNVSGTVVAALDGAAPTTDICSAITNGATVSGRIALIDRGTCGFPNKVQFAQNAGAIGVIVVDNAGTFVPPGLSGTSATITIPSVMVSQAVGNAIRAQLGAGVTATLARQANVARDGTIDGHIVAHEWGHYLSNRLVGNAVGLSTNQSGGMGEGWSDFISLLLTARPGDVPSDFSGVYNTGAYALSASGVANHAWYFGIRRWPYCTDMTKAPLTYKHIVPGTPLPTTVPSNASADLTGAANAAVHRTGEVWCNMLWECYTALLRDTGRLTFDQASQRMRDYLVAGFKLTPDAPTFIDARDALLSAAIAGDPADFALFVQAFAKRGLGIGAVAGSATDNTGAVESFLVGGDLRFASLALTDDVHSCDDDGYLDNGETGTLRVRVRNAGSTSLTAGSVTVSSSTPGVSFPGGNVFSLPNSTPFTTVELSVPVDLSGASANAVATFSVSVDDPGLLQPGPRVAALTDYVQSDEGTGTTDDVEAHNSAWTSDAAPGAPGGPWERVVLSGNDHAYFLTDVGTTTDLRLVSPPIFAHPEVPLTLSFQHRYSFEWDASFNYDGGLIEISDDGGASWVDVGASLTPGYNGTINGDFNPLQGRAGFVRSSTGYPAMLSATLNLGTTYAGETVQLRFRHGADPGVGAPGWWIDDLVAGGITNAPFITLTPELGTCTPVAVGDAAPTELALVIAGAQPSRGVSRLRFALPTAQRVRLTMHDLAGRLVATLADGEFSAGHHEAAFVRAADGSLPGAGVYFAHLAVGEQRLTRRVILVR